MNYDDLYKRDSSPKDRNVSAIFSLVNYIVQFSQMIYMILYTYIYTYRGLTWSTIKDIYIYTYVYIYIYTFKLMHECRWLIGEEFWLDLISWGFTHHFHRIPFFSKRFFRGWVQSERFIHDIHRFGRQVSDQRISWSFSWAVCVSWAI